MQFNFKQTIDKKWENKKKNNNRKLKTEFKRKMLKFSIK